MEEVRFSIESIMEKEDYRRFLYTATFFRNKFIIPLIGLISLVGAIIISWDSGEIQWWSVIISWVIFFILTIAAVCFMVERKNKQRITTDKTGTFGSVSLLKFYDEKVEMSNEALKSRGELNYNQFYAVLESKDYFIFYLTVNQASLIRKKDVPQVEEFRKFIIEKFPKKFKSI